MLDRRVKLEEGKQKELFQNIIRKYGSLVKISEKYELSYSTLRKYSQGALLLPESLFNKILSELSIRKGYFNAKFLSPNWGRHLGSSRGMSALEKKYPTKINEWRRRAAEISARNNTKKIKFPQLDERLAEFVGAHLGDGTMSKYRIKMTGDVRYDFHYFIYLKSLVEGLFGIAGRMEKDKRSNALYLIFDSKQICFFLNKEYNICYGNKIKNGVGIPKAILERKDLCIACLRGLVDTDGSVSRRGKQFCVQFFAKNERLLKQAGIIGNRLKIFTNASGNEVGTNRWENVLRYFKIVGSSNLKHIIRFDVKHRENKAIFLREVQNYLKQNVYKGINLPFKL